MSFKKCKVVMLPTNERAENCLAQYHNGKMGFSKGLLTKYYLKEVEVKTFHLYTLSDEKIEKGDWTIMLDSFGNIFSNAQQYLGKEKGHYLNKGHRKIIATTDKFLVMKSDIVGGFSTNLCFPEPSQSFIEVFVKEYNKGNIITEVMVEFEPSKYEGNIFYGEKIYPVEYKLKVNPKDNTVTIKKIKDSWNREERNEDIIKALLSPDLIHTREQALIWIEENL